MQIKENVPLEVTTSETDATVLLAKELINDDGSVTVIGTSNRGFRNYPSDRELVTEMFAEDYPRAFNSIMGYWGNTPTVPEPAKEVIPEENQTLEETPAE